MTAMNAANPIIFIPLCCTNTNGAPIHSIDKNFPYDAKSCIENPVTVAKSVESVVLASA